MQVLENREVYSFDGAQGVFPYGVLQQAQNELLNWNNQGLGVMEMSHRSKEFGAINDKANEDARSLLNVPANYQILFMQGGATLQYAAVPLNILEEQTKANYLVTGYSSQRAFQEFKKYGNPNLVAPIQEVLDYNQIPNKNQWNIVEEGKYFYYTDNETVNGLEFKQTPQVNSILVSDMTSSLSTKIIDINKYGCVFASAQKNLGPSGVTLVIVRDDLIGKHSSNTPNMFNWKTTLDTKSIFNTPPCFAVYMTGMYLDYMIKNGGVSYFEGIAQKRSSIIYETLDSSHGFFKGTVINTQDRSRLNCTFRIKDGDDDLEEIFLQKAKENGLVGLKGHVSVGGIRVSMFNGMPIEGVRKLSDFMKDFQEQNQ